MAIVLFEDELVGRLDPAAVGKPAFAIHCGAYRLVDIVSSWGLPLHLRVREHLRPIVAADFPDFSQELPPVNGPSLWLNARAVPAVASLEPIRQLLESCRGGAGRGGVVRSGEMIAAAVLPAGTRFGAIDTAEGTQEALAALELPTLELALPLFEYGHDIVRHHLSSLGANLEHRLASGDYQQLADGVFLAPGATLGQHVVTDTRRGPIVLEAGASIGPYCLLAGPVHIGKLARVIEHAALKDGVAIGHTAKIGGEVEASIIEPYTNKQHHGFLGHSYLGSWINLGAGTCNSDLKNTYGQVNMEYRGQKVPTGMQFVGAIVGDYAKTAINTGIFTGKTIGVCSMVYGFVTTNVPSFVNYARLFGQVTEAPVDVMVSTQRRMFERRGVQQRDCDIQLLHAMYALTAHERKQAGEALSLEPLSL
jgi:UDP-N-acetylglucosamine diphosphorylase / glucose-1-phosphate thymidylyltransferase / UDP-N-acetylgalactosamine diphosphorylase / glucosamine-1-phosphate N-acetyltransferase / galactosamine-1-phosphate N-acetyltransferase